MLPKDLSKLAGVQYCQDYIKAQQVRDAAAGMLEALELANLFIENGIELGYIRMPDADTPDSAHQTLPIINAAIAAAKGI